MFKYRIDKSHGIIFTTVTGNISVVGVMANFKNVINDRDFRPNLNTIATIDDSTTIHRGSSEDVALMREVLQGYAHRRKETKMAIVTYRETNHAFIQYSLDLIGPVSSDIRMLRNVSDAFEWISPIGDYHEGTMVKY